jgi:heat shock protein 90kDa beta
MNVLKGYFSLFLHIILIFFFCYYGRAEENVQNKDDIVVHNESLTDQLNSEQQAAIEKNAVTYSFQAEVSRLLDTIINSLYTEKDVFLRELISNSVDGLEKARFNAVGNPKYLEKLPKLQVFVSSDKEAKTLTIHDTGVGMTKDELVANLGTVAQSGTTNFLEALANGTDINLIGQFGVGFYSAFLVANKVTVTSKSESDPKQHIWQSSATNSFIVSEDPRGPTLVRGTSVTLGLRDDMLEFLNEDTLEKTILKYNQYVTFPIYLLSENKTVTSSDSSNKTDVQPIK